MVPAAAPHRRLARGLALVLLAPAPAAVAAPAPRTEDAAAADPAAQLARAVDDALAADFLADARVGVLVFDLETRRTLVARNADSPFNPASNVKLFTTYAALALLGPAHRYVTEVFAGAPPTEDGHVEGPLYLRGFGDPALVTADLYDLAGRLRARGIRRIDGPIVVDNTAFAADRLPPGFDQKDEFAGYRPKVGAFSVDFNTFVVQITPAPAAGAPAKVVVDPPVRSVVLDQAAVTTVEGWRRAVSVVHEVDAEGRIHLRVSGTVGAKAPPLDRRFPVTDPSRHAGEVLALVLRQRGIRLRRAAVRTGRVPRRAIALAAHRSPPLGQLVRAVNKWSNNFMAEQILYGLDDARPATFDGALRRVRAFYEALGLGRDDLLLGNGSGLYDTNRATPRAVVRLLVHAAEDFRFAPDFEASLPIAGTDGTVRRRMREGPARGWVRAKTGTLDGVSALSGYAGARGRAPVVFSILINDLGKWETNAARRVQDAIAEAVVAYAEATAPPAPDGPAPRPGTAQ